MAYQDGIGALVFVMLLSSVVEVVLVDLLLSVLWMRLLALTLGVLTLVAKGLPNKMIARQLFISEATVKSHLVHLFGKLGVDNRTAAVAAARQGGVIR